MPTPEARTRWMVKQICAQYRAAVYGLTHSETQRPPCQRCGKPAATSTAHGLRCADCDRKERTDGR